MSRPKNISIAIGGYDAVSYFEGAPVVGDPAHTVEHDGAVYQFASESNKNRFASSPDTFVPQFGGFCATAMSEGKLFGVDPTNFKISDGKLYLFYRGEGGDTLPEWNADEANRKAEAHRRWESGDFSDHD